MKLRRYLAVLFVALGTAGCGGDTQSASEPSSVTVTSTAGAVSKPEVSAGTFAELDRLNDTFIARISSVPEIRRELMDRRGQGTRDLARHGQDVCQTLNTAAESGPDTALQVAGSMLELSIYMPSEPMDQYVRDSFTRIAAQVYCPDNPAGVR